MSFHKLLEQGICPHIIQIPHHENFFLHDFFEKAFLGPVGHKQDGRGHGERWGGSVWCSDYKWLKMTFLPTVSPWSDLLHRGSTSLHGSQMERVASGLETEFCLNLTRTASVLLRHKTVAPTFVFDIFFHLQIEDYILQNYRKSH